MEELEPGGETQLPLDGEPTLLLGLVSLGDVDDQPLAEQRLPVRVADHRRVIVDPPNLSVGSDDAVLDVEIGAGLDRLGVGRGSGDRDRPRATTLIQNRGSSVHASRGYPNIPTTCGLTYVKKAGAVEVSWR